MKKKIIIQGDDLGYKPEIDRGIAYAYEYGILTSTTIMANLIKKSDRRKYEEYLDGLENKSGLQKPELGVGVHLNITFGKPLSPKWPQEEFTRPLKGSGKPEEWKGSTWREYFSQFSEAEIEDEFKRQIERALLVFEKIDHLDAHQFVNSYKPVKDVYERLAQEIELPVRPEAPLSEKPVYGGDFIFDKNSIKELRNKEIRVADNYIFKLFFNEKDSVGSFLSEIDKIEDAATEIMFHSAKGKGAEEWRVRDLETLTSEAVIGFFKQHIELINYLSI